MTRNGRRLLSVLVILGLVVAVAGVAVACGSSGTSGGGTASGSASPAAGGPDQAHAAANLKGLEAVPTWVAPGDPFDAKSVMAGKSILSIPGTGSDPFYVQVNLGMRHAAEAVGYKFDVWNNQGQLTQYQQGFANGITRKVSLIDLLAGPNPNTLRAQIKEAQDAGILVASSHLDGYEANTPYVNADLMFNYTRAGQILADWVIVKDPKAHVLVVVSDEILSTEQMRNGISSEFDTYGGPDIQYKFVNVPIPEWGQKIQPTVQSEIVADPKLTYVLAIYDNMLHFVVPAIQATNSVGTVKCIGYNATPGVIDLVREGKVEMDFGDMLNWSGWAIADAEMRMIGKLPVNDKLDVPFRLFTKANAAEMGVPAEFGKGYGDTYQNDFKQLWGLQ